MKKLNKIKLTALNRNEIADREQRMLKGGADYGCGCIEGCVDDMCACLEDGGYFPKERTLYNITTTVDSEQNKNKILEQKKELKN